MDQSFIGNSLSPDAIERGILTAWNFEKMSWTSHSMADTNVSGKN
jgi:hypothetical protein